MDKKTKETLAESGCGIKVDTHKVDEKKKDLRWEKPTLEDVSGRVMAQPYIRFT